MSYQNDNASADFLADEVRFAEGTTYKSQAEYRNDARSPRYKNDPVCRQNVDDKLARSMGSSGSEGNRIVDRGGYMGSATLRRDPATGEMDGRVGQDGFDQNEHDFRKINDTNASNGNAAAVEQLPGGDMRVSLPHGYRVPDHLYSPAERAARAKCFAEIERQRNPQPPQPKLKKDHVLPLIPTGKAKK